MKFASVRRSCSWNRVSVVACAGVLAGAFIVSPGCAPAGSGGGSGGATSSGGAPGSGGAPASSGGASASGGAPSSSGGAPGSGGAAASSGGAPGSGGMTAGSGGAADSGGQTGTGGAASGGRGGASGEQGHGGGNGQAGGTGSGSGGSTVDGGIADVIVHDGPTMNGGAYVRTGWTATYTCTGTCPNTMSQDTQDKDTTRAFDGNMSTRWSTGQYQQSAALMPVFPLFFTVDMKEVKVVSKMTFYAGGDPYDAPGQMDVLVSLDGTTYTTVLPGYLPTAPSKGGTETVMLPQATPARFIQLKATKTIKQVNAQLGDRYWAIGEMNVYP